MDRLENTHKVGSHLVLVRSVAILGDGRITDTYRRIDPELKTGGVSKWYGATTWFASPNQPIDARMCFSVSSLLL